MNNINNKNPEVNKEIEDFYAFVSSQSEEPAHKYKPLGILSSLIPEIHKSYVLHIIKSQFDNDTQAYIKTIPMFLEKFTKQDKWICDSSVIGSTKKEKRFLNKRKKSLLLYSAQLLGLMGGFGKYHRAKILPNSLVRHYKDEMQKMEDFCKSHRLIQSSGHITRLTSLENKQKQKIAHILRISRYMSDLAQDKKFTYSLVTLTLPPVYHPNPILGANSYNGATPAQAHAKLTGYWKLIRARFAKAGLETGTDIFGLQTVESHTDSTLHLHCLIYHSTENTELIHEIVHAVSQKHNKSVHYEKNKCVRFDIKLNDGRASGATYVFKYITKSNAIYTEQDDNALKNAACRYFYGAKGFSFFGIKNTITQFNFLVANYIGYKKYLNKDMIKMFEKRDYALFVSEYAEFFKTEYYEQDGGKKLLGVSYCTEAVKSHKQRLKNTVIKKHKTELLIEKKQYCIFEINDTFDKDTNTVRAVDLDSILNLPILTAFELSQSKQDTFDFHKEEYYKQKQNYGIKIIRVYIDSHLSDNVDKVTLNQHYSRKSENATPPPIGAPSFL